MTIAQRLGQINANAEMNQKARQFCDLARLAMLSKGQPPQFVLQALDGRSKILLSPAVKNIFESHNRVWEHSPDVALRMKAAVAAGGSLSGDWGEQLASYQVLAASFLESLRAWGAFDRMLPSMRRVPFRTRIGASTSVLTGATVPQASAKPISKLSLTTTQIDELKAAAVLIMTDELARFGDAASGELFATELSNAVAVATDTEFIAQLVSGATSFTSNGVTAEHVLVDLRGLLANVTTGARSQLFLLTTSAVAKALSALHTNNGAQAFPGMNYNGGTLAGITVIVSDGVSSGNMVLVDASQVAAASETVRLDSSRETILQTDTSPDSPISATTSMISLWQMNMVGLRAERFFGVEKLTTTGVAVVTGANFSGDSPGP